MSRGAGQSAVRIAAYQARERLQDERTGYHYNYRPREQAGIAAAAAYIERGEGYSAGRKPALFFGLYAPETAPGWCRGAENVAIFWNRLEVFERRRDAQIAERIIIALPHELTLKQNIWLLQDHVKEFTRQGRVVQVAIHEPEHSGPGAERNIHAHLLVSLRGVDEHGFKASKAAEQQLRYLHRREYVQGLRAKWTDITNRHLARHGHEARIDHRTLNEQGLAREATIHLGPGDSRRERHGERSAAGEINREVAARNAERARQALDRAHEERHREAPRERAAEIADPDAWRRGLEQQHEPLTRRAPEAVQTPEAARVPIASARALPASGLPPRGRERPSEERADLAKLRRDAMADRVPSGWRDLTVADVARELSPDYAGQVREIARLKDEIAKTEATIDHRQRTMIGADYKRELRWQSLKWHRKAMHQIGWRDRQIEMHEATARRAGYGFDKLEIKASALGGRLRIAERRAEMELEKIRPGAEKELAQRQQKAAAARAVLEEMRAQQTARQRAEQAEKPTQRHRMRLRP